MDEEPQVSDLPPEKKAAVADVERQFFLIEHSPIGTLTAKKEFFNSADPKEFLDLLWLIIFLKRDSTFDSILYYLLLLRNEPAVNNLLHYLGRDEELVDSFLLYAYDRAVVTGQDAQKVIDALLETMDENALLKLVTGTSQIARDLDLKFLVLTRLGSESIDRYFAAENNMRGFMLSFTRLPDCSVRRIIEQNPFLFAYFRQFSSTMPDNDQIQSFVRTYQEDMRKVEQIRRIVEISQKMEKQNQAGDNWMDSIHIQFLTREIGNQPDKDWAINMLDAYGAFSSQNEKALIEELFSNSLLAVPLEKMQQSAHRQNNQTNEGNGNVTFF